MGRTRAVLRGLAAIAIGITIVLPARAQTNALLGSWFAAQAGIQSWSADFVQTRTLKTLVEPLTASGHVWFAAPNRFHWEITQPQPTIAIRQTNDLYVIYPRLKRAEHYSLNGATGQWRDVLALLDAGFPRTQTELESRYNVVSVAVAGDTTNIKLQPRSSAAQRMMPLIQIEFSTNNYSLRATELHFADGSMLRNDFTHAALNVPVDESLFQPQLGPDFKVVEPLKRP